VAEGNHLVTFYQDNNALKARAQVNPLDEVDKVYNEVKG